MLARCSAVYQPTPNMAVKLTFGQAFQPPSLFETLGRASDDPILKPQRTDMYELGYTVKAEPFSGWVLTNSTALYQMEVRDLLTVSETSPGTFVSINKGVARARGVEEQLKFGHRWISGFVGLRWVHSQSSEVVGSNTYTEVPRVRGNVGLSTHPWQQLTASLFTSFASSRNHEVFTVEDPSKTELIRVPAWAVVNVNLELGNFNLGGVRLSAAGYVENLFDRSYSHANPVGLSVAQIIQPPRTFRLKLGAEF